MQVNFLIAAGLAGVGLSTILVLGLFAAIPSSGLAFVAFVAVVVCPPTRLLAQTVPLITNLIEHERAGAASAVALTASTAGSVLGALTISLVVMSSPAYRPRWRRVAPACASRPGCTRWQPSDRPEPPRRLSLGRACRMDRRSLVA